MPKAAYSNGLAIWDRIQREEEEDEEECAVCMFVCRWYIFGAGSTMAADKFAYVDLTRAFSEYTKPKIMIRRLVKNRAHMNRNAKNW